ncbi:MAG: putative signal peptide protein [Betaproteobacteria bacterium]|nr:putative signal peptide protein [Betaproteobacteria bacterium]
MNSRAIKLLAVWALAGFFSAGAIAAKQPAKQPARQPASKIALTAAQIIDKHVEARGGLEAWRKIDTMVWVGHAEGAKAPPPGLPFVLEQKRPNKTRFEIMANDHLSARVFDGSRGWKMRPAQAGKPPDVQPYSEDEVSFAKDGQVIDGPLIDAVAKGVAIKLDDVDELEGRKAYRLYVTLPSGAHRHVWIDAETFLEMKSEREVRSRIGQTLTVSVFYRNYQNVEGLQIPTVIETGTAGGAPMEKLVIEKVALNPPLDARTFAKPSTPIRRHAVSIDTTSPPPAGPSGRPAQ